MQPVNFIIKGHLPNTYPPWGLKGGKRSVDGELSDTFPNVSMQNGSDEKPPL